MRRNRLEARLPRQAGRAVLLSQNLIPLSIVESELDYPRPPYIFSPKNMISKHKARRVTIGGNVFRHKVSTTPISRGIYRLNITIQSAMHNASKLVVDGLIQKSISIWPSTEHDDFRYYPTVTRHEIEWLIKDAISKGWNYSSIGPNFTLQASNEIFGVGYLAGQITKMKAESERNQLNQEG